MTAGDGKPCKRCGTSEWYRGGNCKQCQKKHGRQWKMDNPEKAAVISRQWAKNNPERHAENCRRWAKNNPEKVAAKSRQWRRENPEKDAERTRRWKKENPEKVAASNRLWAKNNPEKRVALSLRWQRKNPEKARAIAHRRRTSKTGAGGSYTGAEWKGLVDHYGGKCLCCGRTDVKLTADHVIPIAKGGSSNIDNIQPLCFSCNSSKGAKTIDYRPGSGLGRWIQRKLFG